MSEDFELTNKSDTQSPPTVACFDCRHASNRSPIFTRYRQISTDLQQSVHTDPSRDETFYVSVDCRPLPIACYIEVWGVTNLGSNQHVSDQRHDCCIGMTSPSFVRVAHQRNRRGAIQEPVSATRSSFPPRQL